MPDLVDGLIVRRAIALLSRDISKPTLRVTTLRRHSREFARILLYKMRDCKPVLKVEDVEGMKIRIVKSSVNLAEWKACGALPTPAPFGEAYNAMQKGVDTHRSLLGACGRLGSPRCDPHPFQLWLTTLPAATGHEAGVNRRSLAGPT